MITRRQFIQASALAAAGMVSLAGYSVAVEPVLRLRRQSYRLTPPSWPAGLRLKLALVADVHACEPWMPPARIARIVEEANATGADLILLMGDYTASHAFVSAQVPSADWAAILARLTAPLGVHAILGNHDWWQDGRAQKARQGPVFAHRALAAAGIPVYENDVVRLEKDGHGFWLAGLGDQIAFLPGRERRSLVGVDDLPGTLAKVTDDAPVILMAHEPDIFPEVPERVSLTLSGHTHGGQVRLIGYSPVVPSRFGNRFAYGHIVEQRRQDAAGRHLIVSGGLGCSIVPVRLGVPPEITLVEIGGA